MGNVIGWFEVLVWVVGFQARRALIRVWFRIAQWIDPRAAGWVLAFWPEEYR